MNLSALTDRLAVHVSTVGVAFLSCAIFNAAAQTASTSTATPASASATSPMPLARLIPAPPGWDHANSRVRLGRLANGDGLIARCQIKKRSNCFSDPAARHEIRILGSGQLVRANALPETVLRGGIEVRVPSGVIGTSVGPEDTGAVVRFPAGDELSNSSLFDPRRYPGCAGGLAPDQLLVNQRRFALFTISEKPRKVTVARSCSLAEKPGTFDTRVRQVLPDILHSYQAKDGSIYMPVLGSRILVLNPSSPKTNDFAGPDLYVFDMSIWPEDDWKTLPAILGPATQGPIDFGFLNEVLRTQLKQMKGR